MSTADSLADSFENDLNAAVAAFREGRGDEAAAALRRLGERAPGDGRIWFYLGQIAREGGDDEASVAHFERASRCLPENFEPVFNAGNALRALDRLDEAVARYRRAAELNAEHVGVHRNLADSLIRLGRRDEAIAAYRRATGLEPAHAPTWLGLGHALRDAGEAEAAAEAYVRAAEADPALADAHHGLGAIRLRQGRHEAAVAALRRAVGANAQLPEAWNQLGLALKALGRYDEAELAYLGALACAPGAAGALNNLGNVLRQQDRMAEAERAFRRAVKANPEMPEAYNNLGAVLRLLGRTEESIEVFEQAVAVRPDYVDARVNLGNALLEVNRLDDARAAYETVLASEPKHVDANVNMARMFERTNELDRAGAYLDAVADVGEAFANYGLCRARVWRRTGEYQAAREVLERLLAREAELSDIQKNELDFLLGEVCDRLTDPDAAFAAFARGNRRAAQAVTARRVSKDAYLAEIETLLEAFTPEWVGRWSTPTPPESDRPAPVFLVGFPRSGTTLLDSVLRSHPQVQVIEERQTLERLLPSLRNSRFGFPEVLARLNDRDLKFLHDGYAEVIGEYVDPDAGGIIVDKLPLRSVFAGVAQRIFPDARFVFALRHPCDVALSGFMQHFAPNNAMANFYTLEDIAHLYDRVMTLWTRYRELLPMQIYTVRYEDLVADFSSVVEPLIDFLGLPWDDAVADYRETARRRGLINTPSYRQVTEPLYTRARGRWERYRDHMAPVLPTLLPWARHWGYPDPAEPTGERARAPEAAIEA